VSLPGSPKGGYRSAWHAGTPVTHGADPSQRFDLLLQGAAPITGNVHEPLLRGAVGKTYGYRNLTPQPNTATQGRQ
jgi:hypothetical protein